MSTVKALRFPAAVHWRGGRLTRASARGKPELDVATPPEFKGGVEGVWSPEELLVASAASCFAVTLAAVAERGGVELETIEVDGLGHVERGAEGRFGFVAIELTVEVGAEGVHPSTIQRLVADSETVCIVSAALDVPVHVRLGTGPLGRAAERRVDFSEENGEFVAPVAVSGFEPRELEVEVAGHTIIVRGRGSRADFSRQLHLPADADPENLTATLAEGVLRLRARREPALRRRVPVAEDRRLLHPGAVAS